jgi:hypothetical protein
MNDSPNHAGTARLHGAGRPRGLILFLNVLYTDELARGVFPPRAGRKPDREVSQWT